MTPIKAIKIIDMAISQVEWEYPMEYAVAFDVAKEALEKQIPKKPIVEVEAENDHDRTYTYYYCPDCSDMLNPDTKPHHCKCGQKLEWK